MVRNNKKKNETFLYFAEGHRVVTLMRDGMRGQFDDKILVVRQKLSSESGEKGFKRWESNVMMENTEEG